MSLHPPDQGVLLGVNIDHVATLRNARGTSYPDPLEAALMAEQAGADCITLHVREDRRHMRDDDVERIHPLLLTRMNLEAAVTSEMLALACRIRPADVCLVPERREEVTTEGGLNVAGDVVRVKDAIGQLHDAGIRVSLFIDADTKQIEAASEIGADAIELHTGAYAELSDAVLLQNEIVRIGQAARLGRSLGLIVNAGPTACILAISRRSRRSERSANSTSATRSSVMRCLSGCSRQCRISRKPCCWARKRDEYGMIYGIGTDILEIARLEAVLERRGDAFRGTHSGDPASASSSSGAAPR